MELLGRPILPKRGPTSVVCMRDITRGAYMGPEKGPSHAMSMGKDKRHISDERMMD